MDSLVFNASITSGTWCDWHSGNKYECGNILFIREYDYVVNKFTGQKVTAKIIRVENNKNGSVFICFKVVS
jgi:hypothetical protein